jgi:hypothetical protein
MLVFFTGCETTTSRPYTASMDNIISLQTNLNEKGVKAGIGEFTQSSNIGQLTCRLMGPIDVGQGKPASEYIRSAIQTELFTAGVYSSSGDVLINGHLENLDFSSVSPAKWEIVFKVYSNKSDGFTVNTTYNFKTSYTAYKACENVADAFAPAVQQLISDIIAHPDFDKLLGR